MTLLYFRNRPGRRPARCQSAGPRQDARAARRSGKNHGTCFSVIGHGEVPRECPSCERAVRLAAGMKMNARKSPVDGHIQGRNIERRQMDIHFAAAMRSRDRPPVDDRQAHGDGDGRIDTAFLCPGVHKGLIFFVRQIRNGLPNGIRIEADAYRHCGTETNQNFRLTDKSAISFQHRLAPSDGEPMPEARAVAHRPPLSDRDLYRNAAPRPRRRDQRNRKLPPGLRREKRPACRNDRFPIRGACLHRPKYLLSVWTQPPRAIRQEPDFHRSLHVCRTGPQVNPSRHSASRLTRPACPNGFFHPAALGGALTHFVQHP